VRKIGPIHIYYHISLFRRSALVLLLLLLLSNRLSEYVVEPMCKLYHRYKPANRYAEKNIWSKTKVTANKFTRAALCKKLAIE
jgi:hypothetical protein